MWGNADEPLTNNPYNTLCFVFTYNKYYNTIHIQVLVAPAQILCKEPKFEE
jgi:hypothetical protein